MSFPAYLKYKDSGDSILGEVPSCWQVWKLAHAFASIGSGTTPKSDNPDFYIDGTIPWVNTGDLGDSELGNCAKAVTAKAVEEHSSLKIYPKGSLLFAMYGATIGKLGILQFPATVNQACCVFSGESPISSKFLFYWFLGQRHRILSLATGGGQPNVSQDILRTLRVGCPDKPEQNAIASFLDRETAKIDSLVAEQQRLIELLKEKRQAVISHAVTKGLNPNTLMKDSGIEWLGNVPEHWEVTRLKYVVSGIQMGPFGGMLLNLEDEDSGFKVYGQENTISGDFLLGHRWLSESRFRELERYQIKVGDLVLTRKGSLGNARLVCSLPQPGIVDSDTIRIRVNDATISPLFLARLLHESHYFAVQITLQKRGAILSGLNTETIANLIVMLPPRNEQESLLSYLHLKSVSFDSNITEAEHAIDLLHERRTALISAAVTGKLDVSAFAKPGAVA